MKQQVDVLANAAVREQMMALQQDSDAVITSHFDAKAEGGYIGKGWPTDYIVIGLNISTSTSLSSAVYQRIRKVFRTVHQNLSRDRTFYALTVRVTRRGHADFFVQAFTHSDLIDTEAFDRLTEIITLLTGLVTNSAFHSMYGSERYPIVNYCPAYNRVLAVPYDEALIFTEHFILQNRWLFTDEYDSKYLAISGQFLGNCRFMASMLEDAIAEWLFSLAHGVHPVPLFNIACAYSQLGNMEAAYEYCVKAVKEGVDRNMLLNDPDLGTFRAHPLYSKALALL